MRILLLAFLFLSGCNNELRKCVDGKVYFYEDNIWIQDWRTSHLTCYSQGLSNEH